MANSLVNGVIKICVVKQKIKPPKIETGNAGRAFLNTANNTKVTAKP